MFAPEEILGREFRVVSLIGEGGFGEVYLVEKFDKTLFALKTIRREHLIGSDIVKRFKRESSIWLELEHENIVKAYFVQELAGRLCLQLEYIPPNSFNINTLRQYIRTSPPNLHQILHWAIQFCLGMEYAYSKGLKSHRDIKPENILITPDKTLKITDFGIAKIYDVIEVNQGKIQTKSADNQLTQGIIGTYSYMSPEQISQPFLVNHLSDIYSFGIVLYELISAGKRPFNVMSTDSGTEEFIQNLFLARKEFKIQPIDSPIWSVVFKCLQYNQNHRYQSFNEMCEDLKKVLQGIFRETYIEPSSKKITVENLNMKAWSYIQLGNYDLAEKYIENSFEINSQNFEAVYIKGTLELTQQNYKDAIVHFSQAISIKENTPEVWSSLGITYRKLSKFDEAIKCYLKAISINHNLAPAWYNLGVCNMKQGMYDSAIIAFEATLKVDPSLYGAWINKAICHEKCKQFKEAVETYKKALNLNPNNALTWFHLGCLFEKQGNLNEAKNCYVNSIEIKHNSPDSHFNLAVIFKRLNYLSDARNHFKIFLLQTSETEKIKRAIVKNLLNEIISHEDSYNHHENL